MTDTGTQVAPGEEPSGENPNIRILREKAQRADEAEAALAAAKRENAVLRSGIDVESPLGKFFVETYNGDSSDLEALTAKAKELGVPFRNAPAPETPETPEVTEPTGTAERQALSDGAPADSGLDEDPNKLAKDRFDALMAAGAPRDVAAGEMINMLANAAMQGDKRVIVEG